jgi:hypothetical protein
MTLEQIRNAKNFDELKTAIMFLSDNMDSMGHGIFIAYRNTLESKAKTFGITYAQLNEIAENYQFHGQVADTVKVYFASQIAKVPFYDCNLSCAINGTHYGLFRRYKNGKIKLLKIYKTMSGASGQAKHRNACHRDRHGSELIKIKARSV